MGARRFTADQEATIVAAIRAGASLKEVAYQLGAPYATVRDVTHRHGVSVRATDDPARLAQRERWRKNTAAFRARSQEESRR